MARRKNPSPRPSQPDGHLSAHQRERDGSSWVPEFTRTLNYSNAVGTYGLFAEVPFNNLSYERALLGLCELLKVPKGLIMSDFRDKLKKTMEQEGRLRRSSLRALIEGKIPGVPRAIYNRPTLKRLELILTTLDALEMLVFCHLRDAHTDSETMKSVLGEIEEDPDGQPDEEPHEATLH